MSACDNARAVLAGRGLSEHDVLWVAAETDYGHVQGSWDEWEQSVAEFLFLPSTTFIVGDGWWLEWDQRRYEWRYVQPPTHRLGLDVETWARFALFVQNKGGRSREEELPPGRHLLRVERAERRGTVRHNALAFEFTVLSSDRLIPGRRVVWRTADSVEDLVAACGSYSLQQMVGCIVQVEGEHMPACHGTPAYTHFTWWSHSQMS